MSRILVIDEQPPQATRDGASQRMLTVLELLVEAGHAVDFVAAAGWPAALHAPRLRLERLGIGLPLLDDTAEGFVERDAARYDAIILSRLSTARRLLDAVRAAAPHAHVVYDAMNLEHVSSFRRAKVCGNAALLRHALLAQREERRVISSVDGIIAVSEPDAAWLREAGAGGSVGIVTGAHMEPHDDLQPRPAREGGVFVGYLGVLENELAVRRLVDLVWPLVVAERGPEPLHVVGAGEPPWLTKLGERVPWLHVHGAVADLGPLLRRVAVSVMPIAGGAGIKTKVLQCFAFGVPVVGTADAFGGIPAVPDEDVAVADSDAALAAAAVAVLDDPALWTRRSAAGPRLLREHFARADAAAGLHTALGSTRLVRG